MSKNVRGKVDESTPHLLNMTTSQEIVTGDPVISKITKIVCCQAVRELRSSVVKPVPVTALTQMNSESTNPM